MQRNLLGAQAVIPAKAGIQTFAQNKRLRESLDSRFRGNDTGGGGSGQPGSALMPEMPHAGEDHGETGFVGGGDDFVVAQRPAGLDGGGGARLRRGEQAVGEGEERV